MLSSPSLSAYRINRYCSICQRTENAQIRLHGCACSAGPSLFAYSIMAIFPRCASIAHHRDPIFLRKLIVNCSSAKFAQRLLSLSHRTSKYRNGSNVFPQNCFLIDRRIFQCRQENQTDYFFSSRNQWTWYGWKVKLTGATYKIIVCNIIFQYQTLLVRAKIQQTDSKQILLTSVQFLFNHNVKGENGTEKLVDEKTKEFVRRSIWW